MIFTKVAAEGIKDIYITSEDTGAYGRDINTNISVLMKEIVKAAPNDIMIRVNNFFSYCFFEFI